MKIRETIYYFISLTLGRLMNVIARLKFFSFFTFENQTAPFLPTEARAWLKSPGIFLLISSFILLFGVNALWAMFNSTLLPDKNPATLQFLEDWPNIVNYSLICPFYITIGLGFLYSVGSLRKGLQGNGIFHSLGISVTATSIKTWLAWTVIGIAATAFSISIYASELGKYDFIFWFQTYSPRGDRIFSAQGYYYLVTNVLLNFLTVFVIIANIEFFAVASVIGKAIREKIKNVEDENKKGAEEGKEKIEERVFDGFWYSKEDLIERFSPFTSLYVLSKLLVVTYLCNMYTWKAQDPKFIGMLDYTVLLLALLGSALVSYPRYHIQFWIFKIWQTRRNNRYLYPELRRPLQAGVANVADYLILGGAMANLIAYVIHKSNINVNLW